MGTTSTLPNPITRTADDNLYTTERSTSSDTLGFGYAFPVTNGSYTVRLHLAEVWFVGGTGRGPTGTGRRIFDVQIEGATVIDSLDLNATVGALAAEAREFTVTVSDGTLNIDFPPANVNRPTLAAIEIVRN
mgnify:CR=1 FL=1